MSEMIERVARALARPHTVNNLHRAKARAAIEAMREPTVAMIAGVVVHSPPAGPADYALAAEAVKLTPRSDHPDVGDILAELVRDYRALIDEALKP